MKPRRMRWTGHVARMGDERKLFKVLMGNPEGKWPLGRTRSRWEDGIRTNLRDIGLEDIEWVQTTQDRGQWRAVVNAVMDFRVLAPRSQCPVDSLLATVGNTMVLQQYISTPHCHYFS
jgi:hypothetical protein